MGTKYRVDKSDSMVVPVGMNSIICITNNYQQVLAAFKRATVGLDMWNQPNPRYGVLLSQWDESKGDYKILAHKGLFYDGEPTWKNATK